MSIRLVDGRSLLSAERLIAGIGDVCGHPHQYQFLATEIDQLQRRLPLHSHIGETGKFNYVHGTLGRLAVPWIAQNRFDEADLNRCTELKDAEWLGRVKGLWVTEPRTVGANSERTIWPPVDPPEALACGMRRISKIYKTDSGPMPLHGA